MTPESGTPANTPASDATARAAFSQLLVEALTPETSEGASPFATSALVSEALRCRATDIHVEPRSGSTLVRFRIDGALHAAAELSPPDGQQLANQLKTSAGLDPIPSFTPAEARWTQRAEDREIDLRLVAASCLGGEKVHVRLLDPERIEQRIHDLGMDAEPLEGIQHWLGNLSGMFLVTGPTGSGKTTTLYALLRELCPLQRAIVTIEDPPEYQLDGATQLTVNEQQGLTFATGLKHVLRLDPDFLLVGEIRDEESAHAAIDAATSGRILLSSMHSRDAVGAVTSLRHWGVANHEICSSLSFVVAQRLVRRLCPECRSKEAPTAGEARWLRGLGLEVPDAVWHPVGCASCRQLGFRGRVGVFETWRPIEEDDALILSNAGEDAIRRRLADRGHRFLLSDALSKARDGVTSLGELRTMGGFGPAVGDPAGVWR